MNELEVIAHMLLNKEETLLVKQDEINSIKLDSNERIDYGTGYFTSKYPTAAYKVTILTYTIKLREDIKVWPHPRIVIFEHFNGKFDIGKLKLISHNDDYKENILTVTDAVWSQ